MLAALAAKLLLLLFDFDFDGVFDFDFGFDGVFEFGFDGPFDDFFFDFFLKPFGGLVQGLGGAFCLA